MSRSINLISFIFSFLPLVKIRNAAKTNLIKTHLFHSEFQAPSGNSGFCPTGFCFSDNPHQIKVQYRIPTWISMLASFQNLDYPLVWNPVIFGYGLSYSCVWSRSLGIHSRPLFWNPPFPKGKYGYLDQSNLGLSPSDPKQLFNLSEPLNLTGNRWKLLGPVSPGCWVNEIEQRVKQLQCKGTLNENKKTQKVGTE